MPDIISGLTALKTAIEITKEIMNASSAFNDAEMRLKFSELYSTLSDAKIELADAQLEMHDLRKKIIELQDKLDSSDEVVYRENVYWRAHPAEGKPNGPFCPNCYEGPRKQLTSMSNVDSTFSFAGKYKCNTCNSYVK